MRRCWKYSWKFCRHDGPCETCEMEHLAKKVKNSGYLMAEANNNHRNAIRNLEKAKEAVEIAKQMLENTKKKIGGRAASFYQVENEPEVQNADTDINAD